MRFWFHRNGTSKPMGWFVAAFFFFLLALVSVFGVHFVLSTRSWREAALQKLDASVPERIHRQQKAIKTRASPPETPAIQNDATRDEDIGSSAYVEKTAAAYARLVEDLERIEAEMKSLEDPYDDVPLQVFLKGDEHSPEEEQGEAEKWWEAEERRRQLLVTRHEEFIYAIRAAAKRRGPTCIVEYSPERGLFNPYCWRFREMAHLLAKHAEVRARQGNYAEAVTDVIAGLELADAVSAEPLSMSHLVGSSIADIMVGAVCECLHGGDIASQELFDTLMQQIAGSANREGLKNALAMEAIEGHSFYDTLREGDASALEDILRWQGIEYDPDAFDLADITRPLLVKFWTSPLAHPFIDRDEAIYAEATAECLSIVTRPYHEAIPALTRLDAERPGMLFVHPLVSGLPRWLCSQARHEAVLDLMRLGLTIERFHAAYGAFPDTLESLAPLIEGAVPLDPFSGERYHYEHSDEAFTLYSVGRNQQDDGGRYNLITGDIVWRGK